MKNSIAALDRAHTLHPWTHFDSFEKGTPMVISRGEGCYLWDENDTRYLDAVGGLWCTNIGLGRKEMAQCIADQAERLAYASTFVDMTNGPAALLAAKLSQIAPGDLDHVHFTTGGSTAIDSAFRMAQFAQAALGFPERKHMIARRHSYHGSTYASMSLGLRNGDRAPEFGYESDLIHHIEAPYLYRRPEGTSEQDFCDQLVAEFEAKIAEIGPEKIAAFFAEPIQASGGVLVPPDGYLKAMWEVCQRHGILFVADEVVTAFGRLGHWFASYDVYDVQPDIICCAKGLSSGYQPIGALIFSDRIWKAMGADPERWYTSGFTYSGHPVACAAALKNIEIMERENLLPHTQTVGAYFQDRLATLRDLPLVGDVRGKALIGCVENVANKTTKEPLPDEIDIGLMISQTCEEMGLFVRPIGALNVMSPSLIITRDQIDFTVETLGKSIKKVAGDLVRQGVKIS